MVLTPEIVASGASDTPVMKVMTQETVLRPDNTMKPENKKKKQRCHACNKKLKMIHFTCKCQHLFCVNHLNPHSHNCSYDYIAEKGREISMNNPKLDRKLVKI